MYGGADLGDADQPPESSGFGMPPEAGSFRIVYLADPDELRSIYADIAAFTRQYLQQA